MNQTRQRVGEAGSCNYCEQGKLSNSNSARLVYPYETVVVVHGKQISTNFCDDCLTKLKTTDRPNMVDIT